MESRKSHLPEILKNQIRFLFFKGARPNLRDHFPDYLVYVVLVSLAAGVGRYWDSLDAYPWQYFGLGSVAYIFVLSLFLFLVVIPMKPANWGCRSVIVFVGLTSLPALLYAIPVERYFSLEIAQSMNAWFLAVVATWRVALYVHFLRSYAKLSVYRVVVCTLLPLAVIVTALTILNLEHAVFNIMAGNPRETSADMAYFVVIALSFFAVWAFPVLLFLYIATIVRDWRNSGRDAT
ncbi:hypothetical protein [Parahalioglobus pacificus]|uniref:Yip1 domain-containing protein n=1 Tax=Parahalioglobus pacificus TaxID=930806 RepID=A0A918XDY6_9GAMM|nr:hypothetical protein [Halioglobus pacificus]GHD28209.1 hypothetical protein GCM10007053_07380 [Halioglobus pacificus]